MAFLKIDQSVGIKTWWYGQASFRSYLGRNETLADAKMLQKADKAYVGSQGSFKALVVSLLSSDSF